MTKVKIKKIDDEVTYRRVQSTVTLDVNGKKLRVYFDEDSNEMFGSEYDLDEADKELLTEEELEALDNEGIYSLTAMKDGEELEVNIEE